MKIIIIGAGQVGATLAENLCQEQDVTLIDSNPEKLSALENKLDVGLVQGSGVHPPCARTSGRQRC